MTMKRSLVQLSLEMPIRGGGSGAGENSHVLGNLLKRKTYISAMIRPPGGSYAGKNSQSSENCLKRVLNKNLENQKFFPFIKIFTILRDTGESTCRSPWSFSHRLIMGKFKNS